jgi:tripartite-type tricarboxylate transporter receptor subunit TctC
MRASTIGVLSRFVLPDSSRRVHVSHASALVAAALFAATLACAQNYPVKPVRIVVPSSPGGTSDILGRLFAMKFTEAMGQTFVVDNRPGASSAVGAEFVARATPDGYTILISPAALAINPSMYARLGFDAQKDFSPISLIAETGNVLVAHPSLPVRNARDLIALAKKKPGELMAASPGLGGSPHLSAELFKHMAGIDVLIVSYKGSGPGTIALLSGEVSFMFTTPPSALGHVRAGRLRPLAVTTRARIPALPDIPTLAEATLPGYEATQWFGFLAPAGTPQAIIDRLHQETVRALRLADVKERFANEGLEVVGSTPEAFAATIASELQKWARLIKVAGIKP